MPVVLCNELQDFGFYLCVTRLYRLTLYRYVIHCNAIYLNIIPDIVIFMSVKQCHISMEKRTLSVTPETHSRLEKLKVIDRETMNSVIERLLDEFEKNEKKK
jgi:hypothetical protein